MKPIRSMYRWGLRSAAAALLGLGLSAPAAAQTVELKISHYLPSVHGIHTDFIAPWAAELEQRSQGKVKVTVFPAGSSFGNIERQLDQVRVGVVDLALGLAAVPRDRLPRTELMDLPLLTEDRRAANHGLWAIADQHLAKDFTGLKLLSINVDCSVIHTRAKSIRSLEDFKGVRLRVPSALGTKIMTAVGAIPVSLPWGQVYENIEKGVLDGAVAPWDPMASLRLAEVMNHTLDNIVLCGEMWFAMNANKYKSLPAEVRAVIDATTGDALIRKFDGWYEKWSKTGQDAAAARKVTVSKLSDADRLRWKQAVEPIIEARLSELEQSGFADIRTVYADLIAAIARFERKP